MQMPSKRQRAPHPLIRATSVRHAVHSMARLMAAYYGNKSMFVYPPHAVKKLPPLHVDYTLGKRICTLVGIQVHILPSQLVNVRMSQDNAITKKVRKELHFNVSLYDAINGKAIGVN